MATHQVIDCYREKAEIYHGEALCKQKLDLLLEENCIPKGLFPIKMEEMGHDRSSGFVWLKQQSKTEHKYKSINKTVSHDAEVTMFVEKGKVRNLSGVKGKEMFIWIEVSHLYLEDPPSTKLVFVGTKGLSRALPVSAFELEHDNNTNGHKNKN